MEQLLSMNDNKLCADCKGFHPSIVLLNIGAFLCINCAKIHLKIFPEATVTKSISDTFTQEEINVIIQLYLIIYLNYQ